MRVEGVITPFPGGIVASGLKIGANKYKFLKASTNEKFAGNYDGKLGKHMIYLKDLF